MPAMLTLGPLFYHWPAEKMRDFYFRIADEAPVGCVYLGEVVCSKREPFFTPFADEVIKRLQKGGKQVILSSLALLTLPREMDALKKMTEGGLWVEANDVAALQLLDNKPFVVGPFINVMNEGTMDVMAAQGARRVVFASELNGTSLATLASYAQGKGMETEVQIFGRQPLAVSMRCYHARAHGRDKDHCQYACGMDTDGMEAQSLVGQSLLTVNGTQTLTHGYVLLLEELKEMQKAGVTHFRLAPQDMDMVEVSRLFRTFLDGKAGVDDIKNGLHTLNPSLSFINGFYHGREGLAYV